MGWRIGSRMSCRARAFLESLKSPWMDENSGGRSEGGVREGGKKPCRNEKHLSTGRMYSTNMQGSRIIPKWEEIK